MTFKNLQYGAVLTGIFATSPLAVYAQWDDSENEEATDTGQDAADEAEDATEDARDEGNFLTFGSFDPTEVRTSVLVDVNEDTGDENEDFGEEMDNQVKLHKDHFKVHLKHSLLFSEELKYDNSPNYFRMVTIVPDKTVNL